MKEFVINKKTGLASFNRLKKEFGILNYVTYDNQVWGNMNQKFSKSKMEVKEIDIKDRKIADLLNCKFIGVLTTPGEATILDFDEPTFRYFNKSNKKSKGGYKFVRIAANAIILSVSGIELVLAPRDCPVFILAHKKWKGLVCIHIEAPQVFQGLHNKTITLFKGLNSGIKVSDFEVFITPYICFQHFTFGKEKYESYKEQFTIPNSFLVPLNGDNYGFDFVSLIKKDLKEKWGIGRFYESGICNYESAKEGNLYSFRLSKENEEDFPHKSFNVVLSIRGAD